MYKGIQRREGIGLILLIAQMANVGFDQIPPITLLLIIGQVVLYLRILVIPDRSDLGDVCISAETVWFEQDWIRLILGAIQHADEWHLYYNMVSMLWKGGRVEKNIGSICFAILLGLFIPLVGLTLLALIGLSQFVIDDPRTLYSCHVGFSGVLFALKVVLNHQEPNEIHYIFDVIPVSATVVFWVELLLIHILVPNSSFLGHLAGILVGILYVRGPFMMPVVMSMASSGYTPNSRAGSTQPDRSSVWISGRLTREETIIRLRRIERFDR